MVLVYATSNDVGNHLGLSEGVLRWILKILHDPRYLIPWEFWYYSILKSCRIFSINNRNFLNVAFDRFSRQGPPGFLKLLVDNDE